MNNDKPKPLPTMQSIKDDFEQAMMTGEIKPIAKCLFKQSQDGLHEHVESLQASMVAIKDEFDKLYTLLDNAPMDDVNFEEEYGRVVGDAFMIAHTIKSLFPKESSET